MADKLNFWGGFFVAGVGLFIVALVSGEQARQACMEATGAADCTLEWRAAQ